MKSVKLPSLCCVFSDHSQSARVYNVQQHQVSETASMCLNLSLMPIRIGYSTRRDSGEEERENSASRI